MNIGAIAREVNAEVNAKVAYLDDASNYGAPEFWTVALAGLGDCEDYALGKFVRLRQEGVPLEAIRLAIVFTETDLGQQRRQMKRKDNREVMGDHAVLVVSDDDQDVLLDNRHPHPVDSLELVGYTIDRIWNHRLQFWEHGHV